MHELPVISSRYELDSFIGEGATGSVFHGRDLLIGRDVAVKVVRRALALHRRFRARFTREVANTARIVHPCFVPVFDWGITEDARPYVSMAYADAGNLGNLLGGTPRLEQVAAILSDVLEALAAIHARGLVHQDMKPQNVLLYTARDQSLCGWVSDLGEANSYLSLVQDRRELGGTPTYMAPEQLIGEVQEMGPWTDLYAVGLMLYEALTGHPAHPSESRKELLALRLQPPPPASAPDGSPIPGPLEEILENLLDPEPRQRHDRAADVKRLLDRAIREVGTGIRIKPLFRRKPVKPAISAGPVLPSGEAPLSGVYTFRGSGKGIPKWNQVPTPPLPEIPPEPELGVPEIRYSLPLFTLRELPLVGRQAERQAIWNMARTVVERSEPGVVIVLGESGTGKTRLIRSITESLDEGGFMEIVSLRYHTPAALDDGYRGGVQEILAPWHSSRRSLESRLTRWLSRDRQAQPETVMTEAAVLARWCGRLEPDEAPVNAAVGLAYLYRHLDAHAWRGGTCLVLDDAHRSIIQGDGLDIARALLDRTVGDRPVLVLASLSAEAARRDDRLSRQIKRLETRGALVMTLPHLNLEETQRLVLDALPLDEPLSVLLSEYCLGNPLAIRLLLGEWAHRGYLLLNESNRYALRDGLRVMDLIPTSIEQLYRSSLHAAIQATEDPIATAEALALTALAGPDPPVPVIREVCETGLDGLLSVGVVLASGNLLMFEHGAMEQTARALAAELPDTCQLNQILAGSWASLGESSAMDVDFPVGLHELAGGDPQAATPYLIRSTRRLLDRGLPNHALRVGTLALDAADQSGVVAMRQEARRRLAEVEIELRDFPGAEKLLSEALAIEPVDRLSRARLLLLLSRAAMGRGALDTCRQHLDQASAIFDAVRDREGMLEVAHGRAIMQRQNGNPRGAARWFKEALRLVRRDPRREVLLHSGLIESLLIAGDHREVEPYRQRLNQVANESGDTRNIAQAAHTLGIINLGRRRLDTAERYFQTASALSSTLGAHQLHLNCQNSLGEVARHRGDYDLAAIHYRRFTEYAEEEGMNAPAAVGHVNLAMLALSRQDLESVASHVQNAEARAQNLPRHWVWVPIGVLHAALAARRRNEQKTRFWWEKAKEHGLLDLRTADLFLPLQLLAESASEAGWPDLAQNAAQLAFHLGSATSAPGRPAP